MAAQQQLGGTAIKPEGWDRSGWEALRYTLYDPSKGTILTRTPLSWIKIILFYCVYYTCLAGFWVACLNIFFLTLPENSPKWTLDGSIIGSNPGVGIRPKNSDERIDSSIFYLNSTDADATPSKDGEGDKNVDYAKRMEMYMEQYANKTGLVECTDDNKDKHGQCLFDLSELQECQSFPYGFDPIPMGDESGRMTVKPCVFLKLNKIYNWRPVAITAETVDKPEYESMSEGLKDIIRASTSDNIYFDCMGRYPADKDSVSLKFYPENQAIPAKYFPYTGGNYQSPMVALQVESLSVGQLLHLECRAWYEGVVHSTKDKTGLVQFEVLVN